MEVLRRNTDYGLRMMVELAEHFDAGELIPARKLADDGHFSYQLGCKLLQELGRAGLVRSIMGPKGGFTLNKEPSKITMMDIINVLQGGILLNKCMPGGQGCAFKPGCGVSIKLTCLQLYINGYFGGITLEDILKSQNNNKIKQPQIIESKKWY